MAAIMPSSAIRLPPRFRRPRHSRTPRWRSTRPTGGTMTRRLPGSRPMNPLRLLRVIRTAGRVAEPAPPLSPPPPAGARPVGPALLAGSVQVRHVDAGSCNGCEIEVGAAFGPVHDAERYGARLVASPRHADLLLVTGVVTHNMAEPLRRTVEATPRPHVVVAVGRLRPHLRGLRGRLRRRRCGARHGAGRPRGARLPARARGDRRGPAAGDPPMIPATTLGITSLGCHRLEVTTARGHRQGHRAHAAGRRRLRRLAARC